LSVLFSYFALAASEKVVDRSQGQTLFTRDQFVKLQHQINKEIEKILSLYKVIHFTKQ